MKNASVVALLVATLASCADAQHRSIEWFMEHEADRKAVISSCASDAIPSSAECMNARKAQDSLDLKRRGYVRPQPVDFGKEE